MKQKAIYSIEKLTCVSSWFLNTILKKKKKKKKKEPDDWRNENMADSRAEVRKIQDKTGASCSTSTRNKGLEHVPKGHRSQPKRAP